MQIGINLKKQKLNCEPIFKHMNTLLKINSYIDCPSGVINKTTCGSLVVGTNMYLAASSSNVF